MASGGKGKQREILGLRGNALLIAITEFIADCGIFLTGAFWSLYVLALGASIIDLGILSLITSLVPALFVAPIGYFGDRMNRKKLIVVGGIIYSTGPLLNAFATSWVALIPGTILTSFYQMMRPLRQALIAEDIQPSERGRAYSTVFMFMMLPETFMPPIAGILLDQLGLEMGMRYMLVINSAVKFVSVALRAVYLPDDRRPRLGGSSASGTGAGSLKSAVTETFRPLSSIKMLRVLLVGSTAQAFNRGIMMRFQAVFVVEVIGLSKTEWGLINAALGVIRVTTRIPLGMLTDRWGRRRCILIHQLLQPVFLVLLPFSRDLGSILAVMAARTVAFNVGMTANEAMIVDITPAGMRGSAYGSLGAAENLTQAFAPVVGSAVWTSIGPEWIFFLVALDQAASALVMLKFLKEPTHKER